MFCSCDEKMAVKMLIKLCILCSVCLVGEKFNVPPWQQKTSSVSSAVRVKVSYERIHLKRLIRLKCCCSVVLQDHFSCLYPFCRSPVIFLQITADSVWIWAFIKESLMESLSLSRFGARIVKFVTIIFASLRFHLFICSFSLLCLNL